MMKKLSLRTVVAEAKLSSKQKTLLSMKLRLKLLYCSGKKLSLLMLMWSTLPLLRLSMSLSSITLLLPASDTE